MKAARRYQVGFYLFVAWSSLSGCSKKSPPATGAAGNSPLTAPLDYIAVQGKAKQYSTKVISTVQLESAIQQFQAMEERFPASFEELVQQHYLGAMPAAPRGQRFTYNPQNGQVGLVRE